MANVYKNIQAVVNASGSDVSMYTSPDATTSIIKTIKLFNTHGSALDVTIKVFLNKMGYNQIKVFGLGYTP